MVNGRNRRPAALRILLVIYRGGYQSCLNTPPVDEEPVTSTTDTTKTTASNAASSHVVEEEAGTTVIKHLSAAPQTGHSFYVLIQLH